MKKIFFGIIWVFISCIFIAGEELQWPLVPAYAQLDKRSPTDGRGQDVSKDMQNLLETEKQSPTTSQNVQERFNRLTRVISMMAQSGISVFEILSKNEGQSIESLIREGRLEEASQKVHEAIMRLEMAGLPDRGNKKRPLQDTGQPLTPIIDKGYQVSEAMPVSSKPVFKINVNQIVNRNSFNNIIKLMNPVIDSKRRLLYFSGGKSTSIGVIDIDKDELIDTIDVGIPGGFLILDTQNPHTLYSFEIFSNRFYKIEIDNKKAVPVSSLPSYLSMPPKGVPVSYKDKFYINRGYPFVVGSLQDGNAAYGKIMVSNSDGKETTLFEHGPEGLYFDIDYQTGKLYATNTGDASIDVFDLNHNKKIKIIDVGTSANEILLHPNNKGIYIRNRLGGSTIYYYDFKTKRLGCIQNENISGYKGIGMWPTKMIYDDDKIYVLSHYGGRIDVIDTKTNNVVNHILLTLSFKPRTDGISTMIMDRTRKIFYAAFPELREIAIADAKTLKAVKVIKIENFNAPRQGPNNIILAVDEHLNKLFVYLSEERTLNVYNGNTFTLEKNISINAPKDKNILLSNSEKGILYISNKILDATTLEERGYFPRGRKVIAFNNIKNATYLVEAFPVQRKMVERVYEYEGMTLKKEWVLSPVMSISSTFAFDFSNNRFYVGYFESAVVEGFDLTSGGTPACDLSVPVPIREGYGQESPREPIKGVRGWCGDGICQPIEKEKGVCPQDCK